MQFKVKIYLSPTREGVLIDGVPFMNFLTRWTFAQATQRQAMTRFNNRAEETGFYRYLDCIYTDGRDWSLYEIDSCVQEADAPLLSGYEVFSRVYRVIPIYSESDSLPFEFLSSTVAEHFPLATKYGGAVIGGVEYVLTNSGFLKRRLQNSVETIQEE